MGRGRGGGLGREMMSHALSSRSPDADKVALRGKSQTRGRQIVPLSPFHVVQSRGEGLEPRSCADVHQRGCILHIFMSLNHAQSVWVSSSSGMTLVKMEKSWNGSSPPLHLLPSLLPVFNENRPQHIKVNEYGPGEEKNNGVK